MPNWCLNTVKLQHDNPEMIKRASEALKNQRIGDEFYPIPAELKDVVSPPQEGAEPFDIDGSFYHSWYDFCVNEWGTKWDFGGEVTELDENSLSATFDTAWSPPITLMQRLEQDGFTVELDYWEPGMGYVGRYTTNDGDEYYDDQTDAPDEIREMWGIDEWLAEDDNSEELAE